MPPSFSTKKKALNYYKKNTKPNKLLLQGPSSCSYYAVATAAELVLKRQLTKQEKNILIKEFIKECPNRGDLFQYTIQLFQKVFDKIPIGFFNIDNTLNTIKLHLLQGPVLITIHKFKYNENQKEILPNPKQSIFEAAHCICCIGYCNIRNKEYLVFKDTNKIPQPYTNPFIFLKTKNIDTGPYKHPLIKLPLAAINCHKKKIVFTWCYSVKKDAQRHTIQKNIWYYPFRYIYLLGGGKENV